MDPAIRAGEHLCRVFGSPDRQSLASGRLNPPLALPVFQAKPTKIVANEFRAQYVRCFGVALRDKLGNDRQWTDVYSARCQIECAHIDMRFAAAPLSILHNRPSHSPA